MLTLSRTDARRLAVRAQLLTAARPSGLFDTVRALWELQNDPASYVTRSADLVLWSRLGPSYDPRRLRDALDEQALIELQGLILVPEDIALFRAEMDAWPVHDWQENLSAWVEANTACRLDILARLRADGPLPSRDLPDTCVVRWRSSGWNNNRNVNRMLDAMIQRGEVAVAGPRLYDLASRVYPDTVIPLEEARLARDARRLRSLGIARGGTTGTPAVVDGVRGEWRVDPALLDTAFSGRTALLSPLDRLVYDRKRMTELFEFDYQLEMYKPAAARRFGYWALPILHGDRLVGKLDAAADQRAGVLRVDAIHEDQPFGKRLTTAVHAEIASLAAWLDLDLDLAGVSPGGSA